MSSRTYYRHRRKTDWAAREREEAEALARIQEGKSTANYETIISGFAAMGIPIDQIEPRENVLTYAAWHAKGRQVMKGQHGVRVVTIVEKENIDPDTGEKRIERLRRTAVVFHVSQTYDRQKKEAPEIPSPHIPVPDIPKTEHKKFNLSERIDTLRAKAAAMQPAINRKMDPAIGRQRPTARRMRIAAGMRDDGRKMQRVQSGLRAIANALEEGEENCPPLLRHVTSKIEVEAIINGWGWRKDDPEQQNLRIWFADRENPRSEAEIKAEKIAKMEADLVGQKIAGFWPTPPWLVGRMVCLAQIKTGNEVLEPSAGKGDIADCIRSEWKNGSITLQLIERNHQLAEILRVKDYEVLEDDFLKANGECDRILMNPPFEKGQDIDHVLHAYSLLRPGGRLVAIMSEGPFFRKDKKSTGFRFWLEAVKADHKQLPPDTFTEGFRRTSVQTRLVVIEKEGRTS